MVKYIDIDGLLVKQDGDKFSRAHYTYMGIRDWYLVKEDGIFGDQEVHEGDLICSFYTNQNDKRYAILPKGSELANIAEWREKKEDDKCINEPAVYNVTDSAA